MIKFVISFVLGVVAAFIYEFFARILVANVFHQDALIINGYKLHHSLYGVIFILLASLNKSIFMAGFGLGIIAQHTLTDGFQFIQRI